MTTTLAEIPTRWRDLMEGLCELRPIKTKAAHKRAVAQARTLMNIKQRTKDQSDYLGSLVALIVQYEKTVVPPPPHDPIGNLKFLLEQNDMTASDLGRLLGSRSMGTQILNGHRRMSQATIAKLCARFNVGPAVFFPVVGQ